jgi:hypothetical protein
MDRGQNPLPDGPTFLEISFGKLEEFASQVPGSRATW